jgi:hypothetical protein
MSHRLLVIAVLLATAATAVACSPSRPAASASNASASAELSSGESQTPAEPAQPAPEPRESEPAASADAPKPPPGDLVCKQSTPAGRTELYMTWTEEDGRGVLRTIGNSGEVTDLRVRGERNAKLMLIDPPGNIDLANHLVVVFDDHGKRKMRVSVMGVPGSFADCE